MKGTGKLRAAFSVAALMLLGGLLPCFCGCGASGQALPEFRSAAVYRSPAANRERRVMLSDEAEGELIAIISESALTPARDTGAVYDYKIVADGTEYAYSSAEGRLAAADPKLEARLDEESRRALNALLGIGQVTRTVFPEGALPYRAAAASLLTGGEGYVILEYTNPSEDYVDLACGPLIFYMGNGAPELVPGELDPRYVSIPPGCSIFRCELGSYDLSRNGRYLMCFYADPQAELEGSPAPSECYIEFEVSQDAQEPPELYDDERTLRGKYPYFFDLDTANGLDVYVWQMAKYSYSCFILAGSEKGLTDMEVFNAIVGSDRSSVTVETARQILSYYGLPREKIRVIPYRNLLSSYFYPMGPAYKAKLEAMLLD